MRVLLDHFEGGLGGGEEELVLAGAEPQRPADAAGGEDRSGLALVEPRGRHRAEKRLERRRLVLRVSGKGEDRLRVDCHPRLGASARELCEQLVVVHDDPVVDPDHRPVADRMVVGGDRRMALRVVADVDEDLGRGLRDVDALEELACGRPLLRHHRVGQPGPRCAYPTASAPRSAIPARRACAASVRSTALRDERLYPAIPHIRGTALVP